MKLSFILELLVISGLVAYGASAVIEKATAAIPAIAIEAPKQAEFELEIASPAGQLDDADSDVPSASAAAASEEVIAEESDIVAAAASPVTAVTPAPVTGAIISSDGVVNQNDPNPINRYCTCAAATCKCCREFSLPLVPLRGPGCATLKYLEEDKMLVTVKYGDIVLTSRTISGRRAQPICIPLPGGYSRFCGRVYGISRKEENFKACLGLELRAEDEVEAALRVSCFQFGPKGLVTTEAEPLPAVVNKDEDDDDEDDDEEDDILGLGGLDDDEDDDDDDDEDGTGILDGGNGQPSPNSDLITTADGGTNTNNAAVSGGADTGDDDDDEDDDDDDDELAFSLVGGNLLDDLFAPTTAKPVRASLLETGSGQPLDQLLPAEANSVAVIVNAKPNPNNASPTKIRTKPKKKKAAAQTTTTTTRKPSTSTTRKPSIRGSTTTRTTKKPTRPAKRPAVGQANKKKPKPTNKVAIVAAATVLQANKKPAPAGHPKATNPGDHDDEDIEDDIIGNDVIPNKVASPGELELNAVNGTDEDEDEDDDNDEEEDEADDEDELEKDNNDGDSDNDEDDEEDDEDEGEAEAESEYASDLREHQAEHQADVADDRVDMREQLQSKVEAKVQEPSLYRRLSGFLLNRRGWLG